ncbi:putative RNA-binding protein 18 [Daphnia magna]|uniref:Putative RNA-binding protein 18 n=1 Tax=Daphnia magna TaxID=35525 RepID=A0A162CIP9_9CRUS|nr:putative RNA-binding protein 18 [Daphnia magna]
MNSNTEMDKDDPMLDLYTHPNNDSRIWVGNLDSRVTDLNTSSTKLDPKQANPEDMLFSHLVKEKKLYELEKNLMESLFLDVLF